MGRDKALLPIGGVLLWQRQMKLLRAVCPNEILWSGPAREGLPDDVILVEDAVADAGPLAGISSSLEVMTSDLLLVLAVDLARMEAIFLRDLMANCATGRGVVPRHGDHFEPLAAIYPKQLAPLAAEHLRQGRFALQDFAHEGVIAGALRIQELDDHDGAKFENINSPGDFLQLNQRRT